MTFKFSAHRSFLRWVDGKEGQLWREGFLAFVVIPAGIAYASYVEIMFFALVVALLGPFMYLGWVFDYFDRLKQFRSKRVRMF